MLMALLLARLLDNTLDILVSRELYLSFHVVILMYITLHSFASPAVTPYQILGILCVAFVCFLFISSLVLPQMYEVFDRSPEELILLEERRKNLKASREANDEAARKFASLQAQHTKKQRSVRETETDTGDEVAVEEGINELWRNSLSDVGPVGNVSFVSEPAEQDRPEQA